MGLGASQGRPAPPGVQTCGHVRRGRGSDTDELLADEQLADVQQRVDHRCLMGDAEELRDPGDEGIRIAHEIVGLTM